MASASCPNSADSTALVAATKELLAAVDKGDYAAYEKLCSPTITCIEPETAGNVIQGLAFHKHYFTLPPSTPPAPRPHKTTTLANVTARVCCEAKMGFVT